MILAFLAFIKKIPWQLYMLAGVLFSIWFYGNLQYKLGQADTQSKWNESIKRGQQIVADLKIAASQINTVVEVKYVDRVETIREKGQTIIREIPVYIPSDSPDLPGGFRVLHDAAAASRFPSSTELPGTPVGVATATETIIDNYGLCYQWHAQLQGWEDWYREQSHSWQIAQRRQR